jgi:hypothetical protein
MRKLLIIQEDGVGDSVIQDSCDVKATYCLNLAISTFFLFSFFFSLWRLWRIFAKSSFCKIYSPIFKSSSGEILQKNKKTFPIFLLFGH